MHLLAHNVNMVWDHKQWLNKLNNNLECFPIKGIYPGAQALARSIWLYSHTHMHPHMYVGL